jgi:1-acyl-sn-glycerol-3-phosphate acyltransferase
MREIGTLLSFLYSPKRLLYRLLKILVRPAMLIFCRRVIISDPSVLNAKGPLLIACNHPNSFLDAIIIDMVFKQPVWSLTRGDVFKNKFLGRLLPAMKMLPVYRTSEGTENLQENYRTFAACREIFKNKGVISIFSEGKCINEWRLRKLKKGTARLATMCWKEDIPLKILPLGINYSSFENFGKNVYINSGDYITADLINPTSPDGVQYVAINNKLAGSLKKLVFEIEPGDSKLQKEKLTARVSWYLKIALLLPAIAGYILHAPLYFPIRYFTKKKAIGTGHYDSVLVAVLFLIYPFFLITVTLVTWLITKSWIALFLLLILPFSAWAYVQLKPQ